MMRSAFASAGYLIVPFGQPCEVCVVHSCMVTANAERDSLRLVRSVKRKDPKTFVVLAGCVAEIVGNGLSAMCGADLIVGQKNKFDLPSILSHYDFCPARKGACHLPRPCRGLPLFDTTRAIVKIQDGCDFRCAYCIVPIARGHSRSRPINRILEEINGLADSGYREVVLTGANIGCYHDNGKKLVDLLERIESCSAIDRIRLSSIEISTKERAVIDFMAGSNKLCRFLHLPLQSGDDAILQAMGRRYTARQYQDLIEYAEQKVGLIGFGTDAIVGFPGEDSRAFDATERLIMDLPFSNLHVFAYSKRKGTRACDMNHQVSDKEKKTRVVRLINLGQEKRAAFAKHWVGREVSVLIESVDVSGVGMGWTGEYLKAKIMGKTLKPNQIVRFVPDHVDGDMLVGKTLKYQ